LNEDETEYIYVITRNDLTIPQQTVQSCHACIEATKNFHDNIRGHPHLVVCGVEDELQLIKVIGYLEEKIPFIVWREPDMDDQITAIATIPISGEQRKLFRKFKLIKGKNMSTVIEPNPSPATGTSICETPYGFVAGDKGTYLKAKLAKKFYWAFVYKQYALDRYLAKQAQNRHDNPPMVLSSKVFRKRSYRPEHMNWYKDGGINAIFEKLRRCYSSPQAVVELQSHELRIIDELCIEAELNNFS